MVRWFIIYIPFFALLSALAFERCYGRDAYLRRDNCVALVVAVNLMQDREVIRLEPYDPEPVIPSLPRGAAQEAPVPQIRRIGVYR